MWSPQHKTGSTAPDFKAELIDGSAFELSDLRGNYVLLDFWGSWCPPCRRDNIGLTKLYDEFKDKSFATAKGFEIVSIALEKNDKTWKKAAEKDGFNWPYQIVQKAKLVMTSPLALKYNVTNLPSKFLIDPDGNVIGANLSYEELKKVLAENLGK